MKLYGPFEGEMRTRTEIMEMVRYLSWQAIRNHIDAGRNTRKLIGAYDPTRVARAATQKSYAKRGKPAVISGHCSRGNP